MALAMGTFADALFVGLVFEKPVTSPRLRQGLRRNQGRLLVPRLLAEVSDALGRPEGTIRLLDLKETDALRDEISATKRAIEGGSFRAFHRRWSENQVDDLRLLLASVAQRVPSEPVYLFRLLSEFCGAVESNVSEVLFHWESLVGRNQEQLLVAPLGAEKGLRLELWAEGPGSEQDYIFDLLVWGDDWIDQLRSEELPSQD
jgi:hypothetical protein